MCVGGGGEKEEQEEKGAPQHPVSLPLTISLSASTFLTLPAAMSPSTLLHLLHLLWPLSALLAELLLVATHLKVLLCVGKPYPAAELSSKRWTYFLFDAVSPWNSLAAIVATLQQPGADAAATTTIRLVPLLVVVAAGHGLLHLYYIATWNQQHAGHVIEMSAVKDMRSR